MESPSIADSALVVGVLVVVSAVLFPVAVAQEDSQQFHVTQGDECIPVTPLGDGSQSVEEFYDYRVSEEFSSHGTRDIQLSQTSQLFVYRGREGLSLVFLHDQLGDGLSGLVLTADIVGLPANGEWAVEDDSYRGRDDVFSHGSEASHIEWLSNGNRTDGGAFRGLGSLNGPITVDMTFNEQTENYPFDEWESPPEQNEIDDWVVRSGDGEITGLAMDEPIQIRRGTCGSESTTTETETTTTTTETETTTTTTETETTTTTETETTTTETETTTTTETPTTTTTETETTTTTPASSIDAQTTSTAVPAGTNATASRHQFIGIAFVTLVIAFALGLAHLYG